MGKAKGGKKRPLSSAPKKAEPKINPFERKIVRPKFSVLGRNLKETEKTAGQSRQVATESRKSTLLKEYEQLGKANKFVDQRIGEKDKSLSREDKALQRFQKERQARFKKSDVFNLEEEELTHMGTSLSKMDDFGEDFKDSSDDEEGGHLDADTVNSLHFGGFESDKQDEADGKRKSKREVMSELIAKSKFYKAERQKEKLEVEELTDKLDDAWRGLLKQGAFAGMVRNNRREDPVDLLMKSLERAKKGDKGLQVATSAAEAFDSMQDDNENKDDFNMLFRELAFEMKGKATDRLKTPEEIAKEEKERLEQLERERLRRMQGDVSEDESEDQEEEGEEEDEEGEEGEEGEEEVDGEEEDEDDDEEDEEAENAKEAEAEDDDEDEDGEAEEDAASTGKKRKHAIDDEEDYFLEPQLDDDLGGGGSDDEDDDEDDGEGDDGKRKKKSKKAALPVFGQNIEDLPFTFEMPENHKAFLHIVKDRDSTQLDVVVHRMRVCHDLALSADNRAKIERLVGILYDHFAHVGKADKVDMPALDVLTKHLFQLAQTMPDPSARAARERLTAMQQALYTRLTTVQLSGRKGTWPWPGVEELLFLKLVSVIFPTTDFQHTVTTPAVLFIGQVLSQCPLTNPLHAVVGLFLANLAFHYLQGTGRFMPEVLFFINDLLSVALLSNMPSVSALAETVSSLVRETSTEPFLRLGSSGAAKRPNKKARKSVDKNEAAAAAIPPFNFVDIFSKLPTDTYFSEDTFKLQVLQTSARLVSQFSTHYFQNAELQSYPEIIFTPYAIVAKLLRAVAGRRVLPAQLEAQLQEVKTKLGTGIQRKVDQRLPLRQRRKPVPIRMLNPRFKDNFKVGRDNDPDRERAEKKKFERMYKKELKGAMRELRKDTAFLQTEREKKKRLDTLERQEKTKRVMNILSTQEGDVKKMERMKNARDRKSVV